VQEVLERSPDDPNAWAARFELEIHLDRGEDALRSARMLARLGAGDADTLVRAGMLSREEGEHALAASLFAIAAEKAPNDAEIAGQAGVALLASGDIVRAEQQFLRARSLTPFDSRPTHFLAVIALGRNDEKEAVRYLKESDSRDPSGVATLLEYSRWLAERGRLVDATLKAEEALKRQPRNENIALWVERLREASRRDGS